MTLYLWVVASLFVACLGSAARACCWLELTLPRDMHGVIARRQPKRGVHLLKIGAGGPRIKRDGRPCMCRATVRSLRPESLVAHCLQPIYPGMAEVTGATCVE
jgi:hypothetical protein